MVIDFQSGAKYQGTNYFDGIHSVIGDWSVVLGVSEQINIFRPFIKSLNGKYFIKSLDGQKYMKLVG